MRGARRAALWQLVRYGVNGGLLTGLFAIVYWIVVQELHFPPQIGTLTARTIGEAGIRVGDRVRLRPDQRRIHRFDTEGKALAA